MFQRQILAGWQASGFWVALLIAAQLLDVAGGMTVAFATNKLSSTVSRVGMARKLMALLIVAFFSLIDGFLPAIPMPLVGYSVTWAGLAAVSLMIPEGTSLLEKGVKLGLPIHPRLRAALEKVREELDSPFPSKPGKATDHSPAKSGEES